jgi:X-X-X-Leu-X-X-Gly heptad repeat protein
MPQSLEAELVEAPLVGCEASTSSAWNGALPVRRRFDKLSANGMAALANGRVALANGMAALANGMAALANGRVALLGCFITRP